MKLGAATRPLNDSFRDLVIEIDEIRSGAWDHRILTSMGLEPMIEQSVLVTTEPDEETAQSAKFANAVEEEEEGADPGPDQAKQSLASPQVCTLLYTDQKCLNVHFTGKAICERRCDRAVRFRACA